MLEKIKWADMGGNLELIKSIDENIQLTGLLHEVN